MNPITFLGVSEKIKRIQEIVLDLGCLRRERWELVASP